MHTRWHVLLGVAALAVLLTTAVRVPVFWANEAYMDSAAGIWNALAADLTHGIFYRPVESPDGYGGTRYAPVQTVLHAGLSRMFGTNLVDAGHWLSLAAMIALMAGTYTLLRRAGLTAAASAAASALILASQTAQEALLSSKGDVLPAALNIWGVAVCAAPALGTSSALAAAGLFALAVGTKVTTVFGIGAALAFLWFWGQRRTAIIVLAATVAGVVLLAAGTVLASQGRVVEAWKAGASTAVGLRGVLQAPFTFARLAREIPETLVFIQLGLAALLALCLPRWRKPDLCSWYFLATLAVTVFICSADGIDTNHLLDVHVASIVVTGAWIASASRDARAFGASVLAVAGLAACTSLVSGLVNRRAEARWGLTSEAVSLVADASRPILAENPLVPMSAGQRPYMLDAFLFRANRRAQPGFEARLWQDLAAQRFGAVVLERDPHTERGERWYEGYWFGPGFIEQLERFYEEQGRVRDRVVYRPKGR